MTLRFLRLMAAVLVLALGVSLAACTPTEPDFVSGEGSEVFLPTDTDPSAGSDTLTSTDGPASSDAGSSSASNPTDTAETTDPTTDGTSTDPDTDHTSSGPATTDTDTSSSTASTDTGTSSKPPVSTGTSTDTGASSKPPASTGTSTDTDTSSSKPTTDTDTDTSSSTDDEPDKEKLPSGQHLVAVCDAKTTRIMVYDLNVGDLTSEAVVWQSETGWRAADCKLRHSEFWGGDVVVATGSRCGVGIIDYKTGKTLWRTMSAGNNPHAVELLPDGNVVVACSDGNSLLIYAATAKASSYSAKISLEDAHGVLWDPENQVVWALGKTQLKAYKVTGAVDKPTLTEVAGMGGALPTTYGHDLAPVYGDTNLLWCTTGSKVYQFNKTTRTFSDSYAGGGLLNSVRDVKGIGSWADGAIVYTRSDPLSGMESWFTTWIGWIATSDGKMVDNGRRKNTDCWYYKCRVWLADYQ